MSLLKWTLAMAGTAMGLRYLSDRQRRRLDNGGNRNSQVDRDADTLWATPPGSASGISSLGSGSSPGFSNSVGAGNTGTSDTGVTGLGQDDLLASGNDLAPGRTSFPSR